MGQCKHKLVFNKCPAGRYVFLLFKAALSDCYQQKLVCSHDTAGEPPGGMGLEIGQSLQIQQNMVIIMQKS